MGCVSWMPQETHLSRMEGYIRTRQQKGFSLSLSLSLFLSLSLSLAGETHRITNTQEFPSAWPGEQWAKGAWSRLRGECLRFPFSEYIRTDRKTQRVMMCTHRDIIIFLCVYIARFCIFVGLARTAKFFRLRIREYEKKYNVTVRRKRFE